MQSSLTCRRVVRVLCGILTALWLTGADRTHAQTQLVDAEAYRAAKRAATATFLDRTKPDAERLDAAKHLGYPENETFAAMLALAADRTQSDAIRAEALRRHRYDDKYLDLVLKILADPQDGGEELDASLVENLGRRTTFKLPAQVRQRIQAALRKLLDDTRGRVRLHTYRVLVAAHDEVAINRLSESLRNGTTPPVPLAEAIDLLDQAGSVNHIGALRRYLDNADPKVQAQAARALAVDPRSRPTIVALARNPQTPQEVRLLALRALARVDRQFAEYAIPLVEELKTDPKVRQAAMQAFVGRMNYTRVEPDTQIRFAQAVERLAADPSLTTADAAKMRSAAVELHLYLRKAFPEIQKHYDKP